MLWTPAYVAVGSNLDDPLAQVRSAFDRLVQLPRTRLIAKSRLFRTRPLGNHVQPDFINAMVGMLTQLSARELLQELKSLERSIGREQPIVRWGPRRIDFDISVFGDQVISEDDLTVPHAGVPQRNFVLYPLADIAPTMVVPRLGRVADLLERVDHSGIEPIK
ncbi:MAG TPA: 2-amino-4-hydroxy-6-hydroxymethyldihydropteridine diphosphokinase [Steroidobacteraceae bacterium]|jgi:2-amino-4-hydroxy-6-hydroxymethyldihydropteridine diphosphokinase|nr:2-amino-4-hydroxy-6-hydroxymethyldihydropteridine diphosphokinase [Steroidobacteraceae bacterium]